MCRICNVEDSVEIFQQSALCRIRGICLNTLYAFYNSPLNLDLTRIVFHSFSEFQDFQMDDKDKDSMAKEMLEAFNMLCQKFTTPEFVSKHIASIVAAIVSKDEMTRTSSQILHSNLATLKPSYYSPKNPTAMDSHIFGDQFEKIPKATELAIIFLPNVGEPLPNILDINMTGATIEVPGGESTPLIAPMPEQYTNMETRCATF